MRVALVNPTWSFERSVYFGCREPHLPIELGCSKLLLEEAGHDVLMLDGHLMGIPSPILADEAAHFAPDLTVVAGARRRLGRMGRRRLEPCCESLAPVSLCGASARRPSLILPRAAI